MELNLQTIGISIGLLSLGGLLWHFVLRELMTTETSTRLTNADFDEQERFKKGFKVLAVIAAASLGIFVLLQLQQSSRTGYMLDEICRNYNFVPKSGEGGPYSCTHNVFEQWRDNHPAFNPSEER